MASSFETTLFPIVQTINEYLSNYVLVILLLGVGIWYTIKTRCVQVRCFKEGWNRVFGNITLNGKKVNVPSLLVKAGDVIEVREKSKQLPIVIAAVESTVRDVPGYIEVDNKKLTAKYTFVPKFDDVPYGAVMEPNLVIEYYSR